MTHGADPLSDVPSGATLPLDFAVLERLLQADHCPCTQHAPLLSTERLIGVLRFLPKTTSSSEIFDVDDRDHQGDLLTLILHEVIAHLQATLPPPAP